MNLQKDFLLGFLAPCVVLFLLMLLVRPSKRDVDFEKRAVDDSSVSSRQNERLLWLVPLFIALVYPIALWLRLGNHVWPIRDSLDRLIVIIPLMFVGISPLMLVRYRFKFYILMMLMIGALIALGIRKTNSWSTATFSLWIGCAMIIACAVARGVMRFVKRDHSILMPVLIAIVSMGLAGFLSFTGSITLGQSVLPFSGAAVALLGAALIRKQSNLTPTLAAGLVMIVSIFLMAGLWWTGTWEPGEGLQSIMFVALPLLAWLDVAPIVRRLKPITRMGLIALLAIALSGAVVARRQWIMVTSLQEATPYYDLDE